MNPSDDEQDQRNMHDFKDLNLNLTCTPLGPVLGKVQMRKQ